MGLQLHLSFLSLINSHFKSSPMFACYNPLSPLVPLPTIYSAYIPAHGIHMYPALIVAYPGLFFERREALAEAYYKEHKIWDRDAKA